MKHHKATAEFATLAEAVEAAKIDLSYNEPEARRYIRDAQRFGCVRAFVMENGEVWFVVKADILLLHKFSPFVSAIHNGPFYPAFIGKLHIGIGEESAIPNTKEGRGWFKRNTFGAVASDFLA